MKRLRVKCAGGSIAQLLALAAAIKVSNLIERDFELDYFPSSTGTYWPFAIESLLKRGEFCEESHQQSISIAKVNAWEIGKPIPDSIVFKPGLNYESLLEILRASKVDRPLRMLRAEYVIGADYDRLIRTPSRVRSITGGYPPFIDDEVFDSLKERFSKSSLVSPFLPNPSVDHSYGVIHYRLGDQRMSGTIKKPGLGTPLDPKIFAKIVKENIGSDTPLYVCSDEPNLAKSLLESQGINVKLLPKENTVQGIWGELQFMAQAKIFVGSWSQVSQFAAMLVSHRGGQVWYPSSPVEGGTPNWKIPGVKMFEPVFLSPDNSYFKSNYGFGDATHIAYGKK